MSFYNWSDVLINPQLFWLLALPSFLFLLLLLRSRFVFSRKRAAAKIINISPFFKSEGQNKTNFLVCKYSYKHEEKIHTSQCLLKVKTFFQKQKGRASLSWDKQLSLPILKYKQLHIAGDQAIEHYLLQFKKDIKVSYEKANPDLSFPDELQARPMPQESKLSSKRKISTKAAYILILLLCFFSFTKSQFAQAAAGSDRDK